MKIAVTGHRPNRLPDYGYDYQSENWRKAIALFKELLKKYSCEEAISGMALGADTAFALAALELKDEGYPMKLHCAIPCLGHSSKWPVVSQKLYQDILSKADIVKTVSEAPYSPAAMQRRSEYMVDQADMIIAFWNGSSGGTKNCVDYIKAVQKPFIWIEPDSVTV